MNKINIQLQFSCKIYMLLMRGVQLLVRCYSLYSKRSIKIPSGTSVILFADVLPFYF